MTIAFVRNRPISKAKGESAGNLFAYINRVGDWATKSNLEETVIPYDSKPPHGFDNMQQVFMDADTYERSNGVVAKELTIAVPKELNVDEARELMFKICQQYEETRYLSAVIHYNDHNPHIHLLLLERQRDNIDRPKEQFFKRHNSKNPEGTGAQKFPNAAKDRKEFLTNARQIIETEANKILARKDLELISFDTKNDDTMLPPAPHLGAKLHKPMLRALAQKKLDPEHDPVILKHPKVIRYLKRQEAQELLNQAEIMQELANDDKQELAKPIHQVQLRQAQNTNKMQQVLEAKQAAQRAEQAAQRAEQQRIAMQQEKLRMQQQKEMEKAELLAQQEAQAIANNERLLREEEERQKQAAQEAAQAAQEAQKAKEVQTPTPTQKTAPETPEQTKETDNLTAWASRLSGNAKSGMNDYLKAANKEFDEGKWVDANDWLKQQEQQEKSHNINKQSGPKL